MTNMLSTSITLEDKILGYLPKGSHGFYIEAGANDGLFQSNTLQLEQRGWHGILVEPSPAAFSSLIKNRCSTKNDFFNCALVAEEATKAVAGDFDGHPMSSVGSKRMARNSSITVPARTLQSVIEQVDPRQIDFVSLDVEGFEFEVVKGIDLSRNPPKFFLIEIYTHDFNKIPRYLAAHGYVLLANVSGYSKASHPGWDGMHNDYIFEYSAEKYSKLSSRWLRFCYAALRKFSKRQ
jgi:FkbM family methyltransferase